MKSIFVFGLVLLLFVALVGVIAEENVSVEIFENDELYTQETQIPLPTTPLAAPLKCPTPTKIPPSTPPPTTPPPTTPPPTTPPPTTPPPTTPPPTTPPPTTPPPTTPPPTTPPPTEAQTVFIFPNGSTQIQIVSPQHSTGGRFLIIIDEDTDDFGEGENVFEYEVYEGNDRRELTGEDNLFYSNEVGENENRVFYFKIIAPPDSELEEGAKVKIVRIEITILEEKSEGEPKSAGISQVFVVHILPNVWETIEDSVDGKISEQIEDKVTETHFNEVIDKLKNPIPEYAAYISAGLVIALLVLFLYQRRLISQLREENRRLRTKISADHDILREIIEKL